MPEDHSCFKNIFAWNDPPSAFIPPAFIPSGFIPYVCIPQTLIPRITTLIIIPVIFSFLFSIITLTSLPARGAIYTWTDRNGVKQFSNIAPPQSNARIQFLYEKSGDKNKAEFFNLPPLSLKKYIEFKVIKIYDGDTIKVKGKNNLIFVVRFAGIDAPETRKKNTPGQPYGEKAKQMVGNLISGKKVILITYGTGGYNRVLAEVFTNKGVNINLALVRAGLAEVYRGKIPPGFDPAPYMEAEKTARRNLKGMWSLGSQYESPRKWRREHPWKGIH